MVGLPERVGPLIEVVDEEPDRRGKDEENERNQQLGSAFVPRTYRRSFTLSGSAPARIPSILDSQ